MGPITITDLGIPLGISLVTGFVFGISSRLEKMNICKLFSKITENKSSPLFNDIMGYNDVKRLFRMALDSGEQVSILLSGPPALAKTMFLGILEKTKERND